MKIPDYKSVCVNDAIEFYQIEKYFQDGFCLKDWSTEKYHEYSQKSKRLNGLAKQFFNGLDNSTILYYYQLVDQNYTEVFWELFDKCKLSDKISEDEFENMINMKRVVPNAIFKWKSIVQRYGLILRKFILDDLHLIDLVITAYEQNNSLGEKIYLPSELTGEDVCNYLIAYIESNDPNLNVLESIFHMQMKGETFPVSDSIRVMAKKRYSERADQLSKTGVSIHHRIELEFSPDQAEVKTCTADGFSLKFSYSQKWLLDTLEYPSILNNFLYLFEFADIPQMRCNLTSKRADMGFFERVVLKKDLSCYYPSDNMVFRYRNNLSQLQMVAYYVFLKEQRIRFEEVLCWFFTEYLQSEFGCAEMRVVFPSEGATYAEKCITIVSALDSINQQFSLYAETNEIDFDRIAISSGAKKFNQIPSLISGKYIYGTGQDYKWLTHMLFSDQSPLLTVERISKQGREYRCYFDLLKNEEVFLWDYEELDHPTLKKLAAEEVICISADERLLLGNTDKISVLRDLHHNEVISRCHYPSRFEKVFQEWKERGRLSEKSTLFSQPESSYFNYLLNHAEYVNGLDIRNKYVHGIQQATLNEEEHKQNYFVLLRVFTVFAIKINDDFCLREKNKQRQKHDM